MSRDKTLQRVLVKGGVISPSELKHIIDISESIGLKKIHFGSRQDIIFPNISTDQDLSHIIDDSKLGYSDDKGHHNIVCSYVSADIFPSRSWVKGATYLYILEQFNYKPKLKINIVDPEQKIVPLFTGHLNFISSGIEDYWYLYIRQKRWNGVQAYPVLIYSMDIAKIAEAIEEVIEDFESADDLFHEIKGEVNIISRTVSKELKLSFDAFPYYEGMHRMGVDRYWLGLYWRNNLYDLAFLKAMCDLCSHSKIGKICLTPWKSLMIKGIPRKDKLKWEKLLGRYGINVRHSSLELNWHLPLADQEALDLKKYIVRNFDQNDISTYGLTFGMSSRHGINFTAIVISKNESSKIQGDFDIRPTYSVSYSEKFDPNRLKYILYAHDVDRIELPELLMELSQMYFDQLAETPEEDLPTAIALNNKSPMKVSYDTYQCTSCLSLYNSRYGDEANGIPKGIPFEQLPDEYTCSMCEEPKISFKKKEMKEMAV